jgi:mono/diheme cytochrome c family protein
MTSSSVASLRRPLMLAGALILLLSLNALPDSAAQNSQSARNSQKSGGTSSGASNASSGDVARGKYIVESVAVCSQCHTPRDASGNLDRSRWLQGGQVPYQPSRPDMDWPILAPRIGGTLPANDADMVKLLTTGIWTNGNYLRLPMPQFRMDRSDAEAVVAYLKTVNPQP